MTSPLRKTEERKEKIETISITNYGNKLEEDENDDMVMEAAKAISGILENVPRGDVRYLIEFYNPIMTEQPETIQSHMIKFSKNLENEKEAYLGAISYVIYRKQDEKDYEKMKNLEIESLSETLVRELENRMPIHCKKCNKWYKVKLEDTHCGTFGQNPDHYYALSDF